MLLKNIYINWTQMNRKASYVIFWKAVFRLIYIYRIDYDNFVYKRIMFVRLYGAADFIKFKSLYLIALVIAMEIISHLIE